MKIAISIPDAVFHAAERLAKQKKVSRSRLYANALAAYLDERSQSAVTANLNAVYGGEPVPLDRAFARAQAQVIRREAW